MTTTKTFTFTDLEVARYVCGQRDEHLKLIERGLEVSIAARDGVLTIMGSEQDTELARCVIEELFSIAKRGFSIGLPDVARAMDILREDSSTHLKDIFLDTVLVTSRNRNISPKGVNQKSYVDAIRNNDIVFGVGPAGTGKTFLAVALALSALQDKSVKRLILTRPAVEAGERLGFLPGDLQEKVNPYLRPLYDAIADMVDTERVEQMIARGAVEVAPLAFMRGRTLNDAFIILDEAQNATAEQMKMFLTRVGFGSKVVVTGDVTQIDLPRHQRSGLVEAIRILNGIDSIAFQYFTDVDVVRHPVVKKIIQAYERAQDLENAD